MVNCFIVKLRQIKALYIALILLVLNGVNAFPFDTEDENECRRCNDEYAQITNKFRGKINNVSHWCAAFLQFQQCYKGLESQCRPDLNFQIGRSLIEGHIKSYACDRLHLTNETLKIITVDSPYPMDTPKCERPIYRPTYKICGLFGDPHLWTFDNKRHTCSVPGAWPLIDNRHLNVQVTNIPLNGGTRATATSEVTVTIKEAKGRCIKGKTYQAKSTILPAVFSDETNSTEEGHCSTTIHQLTPTRVVLDICPHKTKIFIRRVGNYLTVHIRVPTDLMMRRTFGLCQRGCPRIQQMNMDRGPRINDLIASYDKDTLSKRVKRQRRRRARKLCRAAKLSGFYYKSCLFDVMTSDDNSFVKSAQTAMDDFQEINVDDDGKPIVNFTARDLQMPPTKRSKKHRNTFTMIPTPSSSPRTAFLPTLCTLLVLLAGQRLLLTDR